LNSEAGQADFKPERGPTREAVLVVRPAVRIDKSHPEIYLWYGC